MLMSFLLESLITRRCIKATLAGEMAEVVSIYSQLNKAKKIAVLQIIKKAA